MIFGLKEIRYELNARPKILRSFQSPDSNDVVWSTPVVARRVARAPKHASKSAASTSNWCWDENSCKPQRRGQTIRVFQIHLTSVFYFSFFFFCSRCSLALQLQFVQVMLHSLPSIFLLSYFELIYSVFLNACKEFR